MNPNPDEIRIYGLGGENAQRLATKSYAARVNISVERAKAKLSRIVELSRAWGEATETLPFATPEEEGL